MNKVIHRPDQKHPETYQQDLNPDAAKGLNFGLAGPHPEKDAPRNARDVKPLHNRLTEYTDDELQQIAVLQPGSRLETDATYLDLSGESPREIHAKGDEEVGPNDYLVPKTEVPYELWNRLRGITDVERTNRAE